VAGGRVVVRRVRFAAFGAMPDEKTITQKVRELRERNYPFWKAKRDAMDRLEEFLVGDRYEDDHGAYNKDRRLVQIRGQETQDTIRHKAAKSTEKARNVETRPRDNDTDPEAGEVVASLVEDELSNPWKGFDDIYEGAIISAHEKRLGMLWMDWEPDCGPFGEILFRYMDPRKGMWDPAYEDPHHPMCGWFIEDKRVEVERARKQYKASWLEADAQCFDEGGSLKPGVPLMRGASGERLPVRGQCKDDKVTLWLCWYKNDTSKKYGGADTAQGQEVPADQRYMNCKGLCGYRSPTQADLKTQGSITNELPPEMPESCPDCGGDLMRIDTTDQPQDVLTYSKGRRLVIIAPFQAGNDEPVYDGAWPIPKARSFPGFFITSYQKPGDPIGPCDTDYMWDQQINLDNLRTLASQRIFEHRNYWKMSRTGVVNEKGKRWDPRDDDFNVMLLDQSLARHGPVDAQLMVGTGLDPNFMVAFNIGQEALVARRGISDLGPIDAQKEQSGVALQTRNAVGEIPIAHFNRRKNRALSKFYGVVSDYILATYTPQRMSRLNIDGIDMLMSLSGDDLPNYDFVITDTPEPNGMEQARTDATMSLIQAATNPMTAPFLDIIAEANNFPRSTVRKIQKRLDEMQAQAAMQPPDMGALGQPDTAVGAAPPSGTGPGAPTNGLNNGGMVPSFGG